jgi:quercetin dioxygenase-like cupin family protein
MIKHTFTVNGVKTEVHHVQKGEGLPMHSHTYAHVTLCHAGSCLVEVQGKKTLTINSDTQPVTLPAGYPHKIIALEDNTIFVNVFTESK